MIHILNMFDFIETEIERTELYERTQASDVRNHVVI